MVRPSGTEAPGARWCGQAGPYDELRARVSSWPPLRLVRLRRERGSVGVVLPAAPVTQTTGGADATCHRHRHPPDLRGGGDLGEWGSAPRRPGRHDPNGAGGFRQEPAGDGRSSDRGHGELHGSVTRAVALREAGGDRQSFAGEGNRARPFEDRQGRCGDAGEPVRGGVSARDLDAGCSHRAASPAGGATLPGGAPQDAPQERGAFDRARAPDPEVPTCGSVQSAGAGVALAPGLAR